MIRIIISLILTVGISGVISQPERLPSAEFAGDAWRKVVVISDIHGDDLGFMKSLWIGLRKVNETEIISFEDFKTHMTSFKTTGSEELGSRPAPLYMGEDVLLVQMGDMIDRGIHGRACYRILTLIPRAIGWKIRLLYGNHDFASAVEFPYKELIHPEDDLQRGLAFGPEGYLTKYLVNNALLAIRISGSTLFVHGGMSMNWLMQEAHIGTVRELNLLAQEAVAYRSIKALELLFSQRSPLMHRPIFQSCEELTQILSLFGVKRMVVGHTVQMSRRVSSICQDRLVFSDVMISRWMLDMKHNPDDRSAGQASALIVTPGDLDTVEAFYTETFDSDTIFSHPLVDLRAPVVTETDEIEPRTRLVLRDDSITVHAVPEGLLMDVDSEKHIRRVEYIREKMVSDIGAPLPGLPIIQQIINRSGAKRVRSSDRARYLLQLVHAEVEGETIGEKIITVAENFHARKLCVGFVPKISDSDSIRRMEPAAWIKGFFLIRDEQLALINFGRVKRCTDAFSIEAELEYLADALDVDLGSSDESSDSDDSDEDETVDFVAGGVRNRCMKSQAIASLVNPVLSGAEFGLPSSIRVVDEDTLFIPTTHILSLSGIELDANLALQVIGVVQYMHSHNLCLLTPNMGLEELTGLFSVNERFDQIILVDLSSVRICEDDSEKGGEYGLLEEVLSSFINDDEDDD